LRPFACLINDDGKTAAEPQTTMPVPADRCGHTRSTGLAFPATSIPLPPDPV